MNKIIWILITILIIIIATIAITSIFFLSNTKTPNSQTDSLSNTKTLNSQTNNIIDCGTIEEIQEGFGEGKPEIACIGKNLLDNCKKSKTTVNSFLEAGTIIIETRGIKNNECIFRIQYGDENQIPLEAQKIYANTYIDCPINIENLKLEYKNQPEDNSEITANIIYYIISQPGARTECTGTTYDIMNNL